MALSVSTENFIGLFLLHSKYHDVIQLWSLVMPEEDARTVVNRIVRTNEAEIKKKPKTQIAFPIGVSSWQYCYRHSTTHRQCQRNRNGAQ